MSFHPQTTYIVAALACASVAGVYDLRTRRIPNKLTLPAIFAGLLLHLIIGSPAEMGWAALAGLIAGGIFLLFFLAGGMGAGDVKLMTAVGCLVGAHNVRDVLISTVLIGAVMGIAMAIYRGRFREIVLNVIALVRHHGAEGLV